MDYNRQTIANEIASFKYTMKQTNDDISPAEIIDGLMQWVSNTQTCCTKYPSPRPSTI